MLYVASYGEYAQISNGWLIGAVCSTIAILIALYVLRSIGLYKMAENMGIEKAWIAFIPFAWIFTAGKIIGTPKVFGRPFKKFALVTFIVFTVSEVFVIADFVLSIVPLVGFYSAGGKIVLGEIEMTGIYAYPLWSGVYTVGEITGRLGNGATIGYFYDTTFLTIYSCVFVPIQSLTELASLFFMVILYAEIFKKYYPRRYFLFTVLSLFGGFSVIVFILRNRKAVNYADYMKEQYEKMYGARYTNPYGAPYNTPYGSNTTQEPNQGNGRSEEEEPFGEFSKKDDKGN